MPWHKRRLRSGSGASAGDCFPGAAIGVDADKIAGSTGAYVNDSPRYLQSTGFVLDPNGKVITAVYSSGAIGRLAAEDVIDLVRYVKSMA